MIKIPVEPINLEEIILAPEHWKHIEEYTLSEAVLLLVGIDPLSITFDKIQRSKHPKWKQACSYMKALEIEIRQGKIKTIKCMGTDVDNIYQEIDPMDRNNQLSTEQTVISKSNLINWLSINSIDVDPLFKQLISPEELTQALQAESTVPDEVSDRIQNRVSFYSHQSEGIDLLADVIHHFWASYDSTDPNTAPTRKEILNYLENKGVGNNMAEAINLILRPRTLLRRNSIKNPKKT